MEALYLVLVAIVAAAVTAQVISSALVVRRFLQGRGRNRGLPPAHITILRPVRGAEHRLYETLSSSFDLEFAQVGSGGIDLEVIFCAATEDDPAVEVVRRVIEDHPQVNARLLIGDERVSANPKLNNLVKGWDAARHGWIAMIDSNVLLPTGYVRDLFEAWTPGTGLVSSPAQGAEATGLWAEVEAAFLNSYQARWQLAADEMGRGFAQGKVLFWRRDVLDAAGGPAVLGRELAEDVASTKLVRAAGLKVRVLQRPWPQPLGRREAVAVWQRQVRWAQLRRAGFPMIFVAELLTGPVLPAAALAGLGALGDVSLLTVPLLLAVWYGAAALVARCGGWIDSVHAVRGALVRDMLLPLVWIASFLSSGILWHGTDVSSGRAARPGRRHGEVA